MLNKKSRDKNYSMPMPFSTTVHSNCAVGEGSSEIFRMMLLVFLVQKRQTQNHEAA